MVGFGFVIIVVVAFVCGVIGLRIGVWFGLLDLFAYLRVGFDVVCCGLIACLRGLLLVVVGCFVVCCCFSCA